MRSYFSPCFCISVAKNICDYLNQEIWVKYDLYDTILYHLINFDCFKHNSHITIILNEACRRTK